MAFNPKRSISLPAACLISIPILVACDSTSAPPNEPTSGTSSCSYSVTNGFAIPHGVKSMADRGKLSEDQELPVTVTLTLNNPNDLQQMLHDLYDPTSPSFHQFLTPDEFRARYAPSESQVADVRAFLEAHGLHDFSLDPNGYLLRTRGSVGALNSAFMTELHEFRDAGEVRYFAPATEPVLPSSLPVQAVVGLENTNQHHNHLRAADIQGGAKPSTLNGSGPNNGLSPSDIKTAYNIPGSVNGSGQTLALVELDGYTASDVSSYESQFGLTQVPLTNVLIDGATGGDDCGGGGLEVTLDIELMTAIAPGANQIMVYMGPNSTQGLLDVYSKIANDNTAKQISTSWGLTETIPSAATLNSENTIFQQMAIQGQSFYAAAGDSGAFDDGSTLSVDDPASQPFVVGVGGTKLHITFGTSAYVSETSWNDGFPYGPEGGGGGISTIWSQPAYQSGVGGVGSGASTTMRNVPDVSLEAEPNSGYAVYYNGAWGVVGGTSCAAPLWAAFNGLVNQQRVTHSKTPLGFPNTALYTIGSGGSYGADFHDINNSSTNLYFPAVTGYDLSTGWGSFKGTGLFNSLAAF